MVAWRAPQRSCARVASELAEAGFAVEDNFTGLPTAFAARRGNGPLHLAVCAEYDALPGLGIVAENQFNHYRDSNRFAQC